MTDCGRQLEPGVEIVSTLATVRALIHQELGLDDAPADDASLESLGADSLDRVQLGITIEKALGISLDLTDPALAEIDTAAKIAAFIEDRAHRTQHALDAIAYGLHGMVTPPDRGIEGAMELWLGIHNHPIIPRPAFDRAWWEQQQNDALGHETSGNSDGARPLDLTGYMEVVAVPADLFEAVLGTLKSVAEIGNGKGGAINRSHFEFVAKRFAALRPQA